MNQLNLLRRRRGSESPDPRPGPPMIRTGPPIMRPGAPFMRPGAPIMRPGAPLMRPGAPIIRPGRPGPPIMRPGPPLSLLRPHVPLLRPPVLVLGSPVQLQRPPLQRSESPAPRSMSALRPGVLNPFRLGSSRSNVSRRGPYVSRSELPVSRPGSELPVSRPGSAVLGANRNNHMGLSKYGRWFKVVILSKNNNGESFKNNNRKQFLQKFLSEKLSPNPFEPFMWTAEERKIVFFLDDYKAAYKLSKSRLTNDLEVFVSSDIPNLIFTAEVEQKIKEVFSTRYYPRIKGLNLSNFHSDPAFETFCPTLFKSNILLKVIDLISKTFPNLEALNLSRNKIYVFPPGITFKKLPKLKILHLDYNDLSNINKFYVLKNENSIVELALEGNPLCAALSKNEYVREVQKIFPKIAKLDDMKISPSTSFKMPTGKQIFLCSPKSKDIVWDFLKHYFLLMDGNNRQALLHCYHEDALFSMTMTNNGVPSCNSLHPYENDNRNIKCYTDSNIRLKLLKQGHVQVVEYFLKMPGTIHNLDSFTVDIPVFTPKMLVINLSGLFLETYPCNNIEPIRHFNKALVIVPSDSGKVCIANELLHITNATQAQITESILSTTLGALIIMPDEKKNELIIRLSNRTGLNKIWSKKFLLNAEWDFSKAVLNIKIAKAQGIILPTAYF